MHRLYHACTRLDHMLATSPRAQTAAMALIANEIAEPLRYVIVFAYTKRVAQYFGRAPRDVENLPKEPEEK
jgi:hypothetical protein